MPDLVRTTLRWIWRQVVPLAVCALVLAGCDAPWKSFETKTLNPGFKSAATPADVGLKFERLSIPSGVRRLDGFLVRADTSCPRTAAVLIFHGRGETVADWVGAQKRLHDACISSIVFDYSGHGRSSPPGTIANLNADAVAAYSTFMASFPPSERRCLLSHSMGGGPMLYAATRPNARPDCVVVANPFASLKAMAVAGGMPKLLGAVTSDPWDNVKAAAALKAPMLWVHSQADTTVPIASGRAVFDAKTGAKGAVVLQGFNHDAIYQLTPPAILTPVEAFILTGALPASQ
ncbi:MAG TPA: alpha/beta fold hydrolase [Caulobacteraceae bacterium]|jgi:alpha-beta hydrolase superfamily lysophospholipase|nr:alpha/beta fold hydrolase [Caulobacteraceae bacterium]